MHRKRLQRFRPDGNVAVEHPHRDEYFVRRLEAFGDIVRYLFVPTPLAVGLNYAKLALIVLLIFTVQVLLRSFEVGNPHDVVVANELYWGCLASYWIVAGSLITMGLRARGQQLAPEVAHVAIRRVCRTVVGVPVIVAAVIVASHGPPDRMALTVAIWMIAGTVIGSLGARLAIRTRSVRQST